ncbi:alpha/beta fold hydrolase [Pseudonocardia yuanmonensis]|uniref:Alpha/beta fold hydrolase n=1 Tax=Pseudonocardia yuanmonensis TaxID=1095914 RepID=A0ABP8W3M2_9PSEU
MRIARSQRLSGPGRLGVLAGSVVALVILAGCGAPAPSSGSLAPAVAAASAASSAASYEPASCPNPIYPGVPQLDLGAGMECGYLTVPENRAEPDGRTVRLAVARARATALAPRPDPLVYLTGGPGGSGLISASPRVAAGWNADRDVIFLEQRGTWKSEPLLSCPEVDAFLAAWVGLDTFDPATARRSADAVGACHERLAATADLGAFDTTENAADVADLRTALGIGERNLYGVSYGSDLALQTLRDHPDGIRSVVVDSVVPPQQSAADTFWPSAASGLTALSDACAAQPACRAAHPSLRDDVVRLVTELTARPRSLTRTDPVSGSPVPVVVDGYKLINLAVIASLTPGSIAAFPALVANLDRGDGGVAADALLATRPPAGLTGYGLTYGVFCGEIPADTDTLVARGRAVLPELPEQVLRLVPQSPYLVTDCARWSIPPAPASVRTPVSSDRPVLVLAGALDAVTAPANADLVAETLPAATRVTFPDSAHDVLLWSPACGLAVMRSFLDRPDAPDLGCVAALTPAPFAAS